MKAKIVDDRVRAAAYAAAEVGELNPAFTDTHPHGDDLGLLLVIIERMHARMTERPQPLYSCDHESPDYDLGYRDAEHAAACKESNP